MVMTKKEFEKSKEPYTLIMSFDPVTEELLHTYFYGWDNQNLIDKFKKDFPKMFHFSRQNKEARRGFCMETFHYDLYESRKSGDKRNGT